MQSESLLSASFELVFNPIVTDFKASVCYSRTARLAMILSVKMGGWVDGWVVRTTLGS